MSRLKDKKSEQVTIGTGTNGVKQTRRFKSSIEGMTPRQEQMEMLRRHIRDERNSEYADEALMADPHFSGYFTTSSPGKERILKAISLLSYMRQFSDKDKELDDLLADVAGISSDQDIREAARTAVSKKT